jgi:hypothetical protein
MTIFCLEMRSTANWQDVRYREYTTSKKKADLFKRVPRISFTDSGHGIVPHVREHSGRREPRNMLLQDHVVDSIVALNKPLVVKRKIDFRSLLEAALKPFVEAYSSAADPIGDSDLYDEQPRSVHVTLGDCRRAALLLRQMQNDSKSPLGDVRGAK